MRVAMTALTMVLGLFVLLGCDTRSDDKKLTYERVDYIAKRCASVGGFNKWLNQQEGVKVDYDPSSYSFILPTLPAQQFTTFTLNGKKHTIRVAPNASLRSAIYKPEKLEELVSLHEYLASTQANPEELHRLGHGQLKDVKDIFTAIDRLETEMQEEEVKVLDQMLRDY